MELTAAAAALEALRRPCRVVLHTDSEYLRLGITRWLPAWQQRSGAPPTAARSPTSICGSACWRRRRAHSIDWRWVRGHAGDAMNDRADALASAAREAALAAP